MPTFFLVNDGNSMPRWCELATNGDDTFWVDTVGRCLTREAWTPLFHIEGTTLDDAISRVPPEMAKIERDFAMRFLLDPWSDQGWISPDGRFYGCAFFTHDDIAYALIRKSPAAMEYAGWVRVHADSFRTGDVSPKLTRKQEDTILALGFEDVYPGASRKPGFSIDKTQPAPRFAVKPPPEIVPLAAMPKPEEIPIEVDLFALTGRLGLHRDFGSLLATPRETIPDVGGGTWLWMLRYDDFDIGGEATPKSTLSEAGIHLRATSFDTIEVSPWPFSGIEIDDDARDILKSATDRRNVREDRKARAAAQTAAAP